MHIGRHKLAMWSSTQRVVPPSSAESQYYSMVHCASECIGLANTIRELGHEAHVGTWIHAAAVRDQALRSGGAMKHMEGQYFGLQETEKQRAEDREDPWHDQFRLLDDETPG